LICSAARRAFETLAAQLRLRCSQISDIVAEAADDRPSPESLPVTLEAGRHCAGVRRE
jgi:hypothetical protein